MLFLKKELTEAEFRIQLQRRYKKMMKETELVRIYQTVSQVGRELIEHLLTLTSAHAIEMFSKQLESFMECSNVGIQTINKSFSSHISLLSLS
jgi:hypothetical protein